MWEMRSTQPALSLRGIKPLSEIKPPWSCFVFVFFIAVSTFCLSLFYLHLYPWHFAFYCFFILNFTACEMPNSRIGTLCTLESFRNITSPAGSYYLNANQYLRYSHFYVHKEVVAWKERFFLSIKCWTAGLNPCFSDSYCQIVHGQNMKWNSEN